MSVTVEKAMKTFLDELRQYRCNLSYSGGIVLHFAPVGDTGFYVGTLTAYDENGLKSENAIPFNQFIQVVNEIEDLLEPYKTKEFTGTLEGWNADGIIKSFLYNKKVHRVFFLEEQQVLPFVKSYTNPARVAKRDVDVIVTFG